MTASTSYLLKRLAFCDKRWEAAMCHKAYRDEPTEEKPFTEEEWRRYVWADMWRDAFHHYEELLYREKEVRHGMLEGLTQREPLVVYEA